MFADKLCSLSDEDLLRLYCHKRSHKAFREIYQRYKDALFRYCAQMTQRNCVLIMETLWESLLENPPQLRERRLKNWLYIQVNKLIQNPPVPGPDPSQQRDALNNTLRSAIESSDVLRAVQQLPNLQRNVYLLFTECGLSLATVADIEKLTLAQCRQALEQSKQRIDFVLNGSARKPWKSSVTLAAEAAAAAAAAAASRDAEREQAERIKNTQSSGPLSAWSPRKRFAKITAVTPATAERSVEVAQA